MSKKDNDKQNKPDNYLRGIYSSKRRALIMQPPETLTIGQRLRRERYLRRWSQEQMAVFLDISTSYYGALERGECSAERRIHDSLHLSYDYLHLGITVSGEAISKYVHESVRHSTRHNIDVMLGVCTPDEMENCYELIHTYLISRRRRMYVSNSGDTADLSDHSSSGGTSHETKALPDSILPKTPSRNKDVTDDPADDPKAK